MDDVTPLEERLERVKRGVAELRTDLSMTRDEMNARFDESRRHFEVLLEANRDDIRLVAEGVAALGERMERGFADIRELIAGNHRFWEVAFLDHERRIRGLEEGA